MNKRWLWRILILAAAAALCAGMVFVSRGEAPKSAGSLTLWYMQEDCAPTVMQALLESCRRDTGLRVEATAFSDEKSLGEAFENGKPDLLFCNHFRAASLAERGNLSPLPEPRAFSDSLKTAGEEIGSSFFPIGGRLPVLLTNTALSGESFESLEALLGTAGTKPFVLSDDLSDLLFTAALSEGHWIKGEPEEDKADSAAVLGRLSGLYRREMSRVAVDMDLKLKPGENVELRVSDGSRQVTVGGPEPEPVHSREPDLRGQLERTGGTPFLLRELRLNAEPGWTAKLNPLRREALEKLLEAREQTEPWPVKGEFLPPVPDRKKAQPKLRLRFETKEQFFDLPEAEALYLPVEELDGEWAEAYGHKLIGELPRLLFPGGEEALKEKLRTLRERGLGTLCAGNPGTVRLARELGFRVSGGFDLNILNSRALKEWAALGVGETLLSPEIRLAGVDKLGGGIPRGIVAYGHLPLMLYRCCPMQGKKDCLGCDGRRQLTDRQGEKFTVLCHRKQFSSLLNPVPLYVSDRDLDGLDFQLAYFTTEDAETCRAVAARMAARQPFPGRRTLGPYCRSML